MNGHVGREPLCCVALGESLLNNPHMVESFYALNGLTLLIATLALMVKFSYRFSAETPLHGTDNVDPFPTGIIKHPIQLNRLVPTGPSCPLADVPQVPDDTRRHPDTTPQATPPLTPPYSIDDPSHYAAAKEATIVLFSQGVTTKIKALDHVWGITNKTGRSGSPWVRASRLFDEWKTEFDVIQKQALRDTLEGIK